MEDNLKDRRERCIVCGVSVNNACLFRTTPLGEAPANWMCVQCINRCVNLQDAIKEQENQDDDHIWSSGFETEADP